MSTQDNSGVSFSILPEESQQHFRLLELPPELLTLVTSDKPPILQFKSTNSASSDAPEAVLCTQDKTYHIRQVNTSNSLYVTLPTAGDEGTGDSVASSTIQAIAQNTFTLELIPGQNPSARSHLKAALPTYSSTGPQQRDDTPTSKLKLFQHIPLSYEECTRAWKDLSCFEMHDFSGCFVPTAKARAQAWRLSLDAALAEGIDLTTTMTAETVDRIVEPDEGPIELSRAVLRSFSSENLNGDMTIDEYRCVRQVGLNELESRVGSTPVDEFTRAWADALPEKWRGQAQLQLLKGSYELEGRQITFVDTMTPDKAEESTSAKSTLGAKRKWHEKFRASKKVA